MSERNIIEIIGTPFDFNKIIENPMTTLEHLISEEEIIQEIKIGNKKIIQFFTRLRVRKLITYLTIEPKNDSNFNRAYKFPFISCEILNSECKEILEILFSIPTQSTSKPAELGRETLKDLLKEKTESEIQNTNKPSKQSCDNNLSPNSNKEVASFNLRNDTNSKEPEKDVVYSIEEEKRIVALMQQESMNRKKNNIDLPKVNVPASEGKSNNTNIEITIIPEYISSVKGNDECKIISSSANKINQNNLGVTISNIDEVPDDYKFKSLISILLEFISNEKELNIVLAGYFSKIILTLIKRDDNNLLNQFLEGNRINSLLYHSYNRSISEILIGILFKEKLNGQISEKENNFLKEKKKEIIRGMLDIVLNLDCSETIFSITMIVCRIIELPSLFEYLLNQEILETINKTTQRHHPIALRASLTILIALLKHTKTMSGNIPSEKLDFFKYDIIVKVLKYCDIVVDILYYNNSQKNQMGTDTNILGLALLKVTEYIFYLVWFDDPKISLEIRKNNIYSKFITFFKKYPMSSILHKKIQQTVICALKSEIPDSYEYFSKEIQVAEMIINITSDAKMNYKRSGKSISIPSISFINEIAKTLYHESLKKKYIEVYLNNTPNWTKCITEILEREQKEIKSIESPANYKMPEFLKLKIPDESTLIKKIINSFSTSSTSSTSNNDRSIKKSEDINNGIIINEDLSIKIKKDIFPKIDDSEVINNILGFDSEKEETVVSIIVDQEKLQLAPINEEPIKRGELKLNLNPDNSENSENSKNFENSEMVPNNNQINNS